MFPCHSLSSLFLPQCEQCATRNEPICWIPYKEGSGNRCHRCNHKHVKCSLVTSSPAARPRRSATAPSVPGSGDKPLVIDDDESPGESPSNSPRAGKPSVIQKLSNKLLSRKTGPKEPAASDEVPFNPDPRKTRAQARQTVYVEPPPMPPPRSRVMAPPDAPDISPLSIPDRLPPVPSMSRAPSNVNSPFDSTDHYSLPPRSPFSPSMPSVSSSSLLTDSSRPRPSIVPGSSNYKYELARLQIQYRRSQDSLKAARRELEEERKAYEEQAASYEQEIRDINARHDASLRTLRQKMGTNNPTYGNPP